MNAYDILALFSEAYAALRRQKGPAITVALIIAAMCVTFYLTVGRAAAAQIEVQDHLEAAGSRNLQISDVRGDGVISPSVVDVLSTMNTIERIVGLSVPIDVYNARIGRGGIGVPSWHVVGDLRDALQLTSGRWPRAGEAIASESAQEALGMDAPSGAVVTAVLDLEAPIVGSYRALSPYNELDAGVVVVPVEREAVRTLDMVVVSARSAAETETAVLEILNAAG